MRRLNLEGLETRQMMTADVGTSADLGLENAGGESDTIIESQDEVGETETTPDGDEEQVPRYYWKVIVDDAE